MLVEGKLADLRSFIASLVDVEFGREAGKRFWSRWDAQIATLERVLERDRWHAEVLEKLATMEAEKRVRER